MHDDEAKIIIQSEKRTCAIVPLFSFFVIFECLVRIGIFRLSSFCGFFSLSCPIVRCQAVPCRLCMNHQIKRDIVHLKKFAAGACTCTRFFSTNKKKRSQSNKQTDSQTKNAQYRTPYKLTRTRKKGQWRHTRKEAKSVLGRKDVQGVPRSERTEKIVHAHFVHRQTLAFDSGIEWPRRASAWACLAGANCSQAVQPVLAF